MKREKILGIIVFVALISGVSLIALKSSLYKSVDNKEIDIDNNVSSVDINTGDTGSDNGAYYNNLTINSVIADPTIIKYDGCLYAFGTDYAAYKSCDSKNWSKHSYAINGNLPQYNFFWAPEIHKIGNYYYMLFTLVTWGQNYPWSSDSHGSVYYARSTDLKNFTYLGEMPYGSSYFDGKVDNKNHIDGSLLIDGNKYYHYYKLDTMDKTVPNNEVQELYGVEVSLNSNGTFSQVGSPKLIIRRNKEANPADSSNITWYSSEKDFETIDEGPYVIKKNGKYYLTFSTGNYTNDTYRVLVATASSPLGPYFRDKTGSSPRFFLTGHNYTNGNATDPSRNSSKYIYGTGHGSILTLSFNDSLIGNYNEYYYAYHSNIYEGGTFKTRKFTLDGIGFDNSGNMYVNGPTTDNQPLVSGSKYNGVTYYKVPASKFGSTVLSDGIKYSSKSIKAKTLTTKEISFNFKNNERLNITDVWIYGDGNNLGTVNGTIYINDSSYTRSFSYVSSGSSLKIQLPSIDTKIKNMKIVFSSSLALSEVELIRNSTDNYYLVSFNGNGGNTPKSNVLVTHDAKTNCSISNTPTRSGYKFLGWYTAASGGTLVYKTDGNCNTSATSYWNSSSKWIYKNDVTLYAHWEKLATPTPTPAPTATPPATPIDIKGDINGDGKVTSADYILIKKHIIGTSKLTDIKLKKADVNKDNNVSSTDYIAIKKIIINAKK